jgi:hypothetical protein
VSDELRGYDAWKTTEPDSHDPGRDQMLEHCDECRAEIRRGDYLVFIACVGLFCSHKCANKACLKHEQAMAGRHA